MREIIPLVFAKSLFTSSLSTVVAKYLSMCFMNVYTLIHTILYEAVHYHSLTFPHTNQSSI